jgi:hypothetical protein
MSSNSDPIEDFAVAHVNPPAVIVLRPRGRMLPEAYANMYARVEAMNLPEGIRVMLVEDCDVMVVGGMPEAEPPALLPLP